MWRADTLNSVLAGTSHGLPRLPRGVGFTISVRRATRIGASDGAPIEDVGIVGHRAYAMTRDDLLDGNGRPARVLRPAPRRRAEHIDERRVGRRPSSPSLSPSLDRVDVYVDDRPRASVDVDDGCTLELTDVREQIRVEGYRGSNVKQVRMIRIA